MRGRKGGICLKRLIMVICLLFCLLAMFTASAESISEPYEWKQATGRVVRKYESDSLRFTVRRIKIKTTTCYVTFVWMRDPGRQVRKVNSAWRKHLALPETLAKQVPEAALVINGSGYVTKTYPEIPDSYPGKSEDYYFTSLGSLVMTNGEILRNLEDVPFNGVVLNRDGLTMYVNAATADILATDPISTWSFYDGCTLIDQHTSIVDREWEFADHTATRTILACIDRNNFVILTATNNRGLRLTTGTDFLMEQFDPVWAFNLDGGPSSTLMAWKKGTRKLTKIFGGERKDFDIMCFCVDE